MKDAIDAAKAKRAAKEAARIASKGRKGTPQEFWDLVDSSRGPEACHPWTGRTLRNTPTEQPGSYLHGVFYAAGCQSFISNRVLCFMVFGREPPSNMDVTPICGDHMCNNVRHMAITPRGGGSSPKKLNAGVPAEEFFAE